MTASEAYLEAQRRIHAAKQTGQHWLDLGDIDNLEAIPEEIRELKELRELGVGRKQYNEKLVAWEDADERWAVRRPIHDLSPLAELFALQSLDLHSILVTDLSPLAGLSSLHSLHLSLANVSDLSPLVGLSNLQSLDLSVTQVSDLSQLTGLSALRSLHLAYTRVSDLSLLAGLSALQSLDLSNARVSDLSPLAGLYALQALDLQFTRVSDLSALAGLSALQSLNLSRTQVCDLCPLSGLSTLHALYLASTPVSDLSPLARFSALQSLHLAHTEVSDLSPLAELPTLQSLDLASTEVCDLSPLSGLSALQSLDLSDTRVSDLSPLTGLSALQSLNVASTEVSDLSALAGLSALQSLDLANTQVCDLSPVAGLSALQSLDLANTQVCDLAPLAGLSALQSLSASYSTQVQHWEALKNHAHLSSLDAREMDTGAVPLEVVLSWPRLEDLKVDQMKCVPTEILSEEWDDNCVPRLRAWQQDLAAGEIKDQEVKVFVLGNGTAGKTQLCRRLRGLGFDASIPSTHAVQFTELEVMPDVGSGAVKARLWDFGGQDIYHGTHALFLEGRAVFVLVWNPEVEAAGAYEEGGLSLHHHSLTYWLDYVRSLAGKDAAIVVAQSKCDRETDRATPPLPVDHGFKRPPATVTCSAKEGEIDELKAALRSATRYLLEVHGSYRLPTSWVTVKERLRGLRLTQKTMARETFDALCRETHGTSVPAALLTYLHRCGEVFYRENLFRDEIVLDQEWAVRAIYAVVDRKGACQQLRQMGGVFPAGLLNTLAWQGEYTADEQETLVGMMESCSIAFPLSYTDNFSARWMAVPDLLPLEKDVQNRVQALWHEGVTVETVTLEYDFLHSGILREFLCQIGRQGGTNAAYWRYGCCFYDAKTRSRARVRAQLNATPENPGRGVILIETCEGQSGVLLEQVREAILNIRLGPEPRVIRPEGAAAAPERSAESSGTLTESLNIQPAPTEKQVVYLSYAWGGEKEKLVDRLEARLIREGYEVKRDNRSTRPGDWISQFMIEIGRAERVCVVLSEKYLRSIYCMRELCFLYERSLGEKDEFLSKIVPLVLEDAAISKVTDRLKHVKHWECELKELKEATTGVDPCNWGGAAEDMAMISSFCHHTEKMLRHASDYLLPRGIANIEKDDFAAVLEALTRKN